MNIDNPHDDEYLDKIFESMFTAKKTGTGLVICKSIIEQQGAVSQKVTSLQLLP